MLDTIFRSAYPVATEPAATALCSVAVTLHLSPREKRKLFLEIANPRPNAEGLVRTRISLFHAERHIKNGRAVRVNERMELDADGGWLAFRSFVNEGGTVTQEWLANRCIQGATPAKVRLRTAAEIAADQRAVDLWAVVPRVAGRSLADFLANQAHLRQCQPEPVNPQLRAMEDRLTDGEVDRSELDPWDLCLKALDSSSNDSGERQ